MQEGDLVKRMVDIMEELSGYIECKYAERTKFGLFCEHSRSIIPNDKDYRFPCPDDSGTDGKRNGICYGFAAFKKVE